MLKSLNRKPVGFRNRIGKLTGPYHQSYDYDAFGNMTSRAGRLWSGSDYSTTYVNDRDQNWSYNSEGDAVTQTTLRAVFDAAGRRSSSTAPSRRIGTQTVNLQLDETYDGDGQQVKEVASTGGAATTYRLRSGVLGGQIVDECSVAMSQVNVGAAVETDPYETPSVAAIVWKTGETGFAVFHALADGFEGYVPVNAVYGKNGFWHYPGSDSGGSLRQSNLNNRRLLGEALDETNELLKKKKCRDFVVKLLYLAFIKGAGASPGSFEELGAVLALTSTDAVTTHLDQAVASATIRADTPNENRAEAVYSTQGLTVYRDFFEQSTRNQIRVNGDPSVRWDQRTLLEKAQSLLHEGLHLTIPNASDAALGEIISNKPITGSDDARRRKGSAIINDAVAKFCNGKD
jgi:hypothetical protein